MTAQPVAPAAAGATTAELLLEWDQRRPRSKQTEFGMSELGGCRRRAGYRLAGVKPTNAGGSVQAVMGTAIHAAVESVFAEMQAAGLIPADDLVEHEVRFAGILGHLDRYEAGVATLRDVKTTSDRWLQKMKAAGEPSTPHLWQTSCYAAALIAEGRPVRRIGIDYLARDTGNEWRWEGQFNPQHVKDALAWVKTVRSTELQFLPRDHQPDSAWCEHCPFFGTCWDGGVAGRDPRSVLYAENPDAVRWTEQLAAARDAKAEAEKLEKEAKGALDALRPNESGTELVDVGYPGGILRWTVITSERLDSDAVKREYKKAGAMPPIKPSTSVRLEIVAPDGAKIP